MAQATIEEGVGIDPLDDPDLPFVKELGSNLWRWDHDKFMKTLSPAQRRNHERSMKVFRIQLGMRRRMPWLQWNVIGVAYTFWTCLFDEGVRNTLNPHWGAMAFSYLNDGMKPTLWHVIQQIFFHDGKYSGIWPGGAPKNKDDAERKLARFRKTPVVEPEELQIKYSPVDE